MPYLDPETGEYNDSTFALDTHSAIGDEPSIFDSAAGVITKGVPITGLAIINSFANTGIELGNFITGSENKLMTIQDEVGDGDLNDYYEKHSQGIETAALVAGSLIPGTLGIKALKLAQAGRMTETLARATNIFAGPKERIVQDALAQINAGDGALFGSFNADKFKAIALGFGDQALQALTFEVATAATMKASPLLDSQDLSDVASNMFYGALVGGGIGGIIDGIGVRSVITKALTNADIATKAQEVATYLGKGGYFAGDRVASLISSIDDIPAASNLLGSKKAEATRQTAILNSKKILGSIVDSDDKDVTNSVFNVLLDMKEKGGLGKEDMYNYLARLDKVSRLTSDTADDAPAGTVFYVNKFASKDGIDWNRLVTDKPDEAADASLSYRLKPYATNTNVSRFDETLEGTNTPKYANAQEAFDGGADLFINKDLKIIINKDAPNIESVARAGESRALNAKEEAAYRETGNLPPGAAPLRTTPIVLNTITGDITDSAVPVVGDYGKVALFDKGLAYGDKTSLQSISSVITPETPTIDANARYVWWSQRGLQKGDTIEAGDIAGLEQLYREGSKFKGGYDSFLESLEKRGINLSDGEVPGTLDGLQTELRQQKDQLIADLSNPASKLSSEDISLRANVPESYLANTLKADKPSDFIIDPTQHEIVNHAKLQYNIGNIYQNDGMILRGMLDVQYRIGIIKDNLKAAAANYFGAGYEKYLASMSAADANILGVGPKFFAASNSDYGSLGQQMERIGKFLTQLLTEKMDGVSSRLASPANAIRADARAGAEAGAFDAVRQRTGEKFAFLPDALAQKYFPNLQEGQRVAVLSDSIKKMKGNQLDWNAEYTPENFINIPPRMLSDRAEQPIPQPKGNYTYHILNKTVADFEQANAEVNDVRLAARNSWYEAQGLNRRFELGNLYAPSIDTTKYPYVALVKGKQGAGLMDDGVSAITAETADGLEQIIASIDSSQFSVFTKSDIKKYHEVLGDYEYDRNFANSQVNTMLMKRGILNNIYPETRSENIVKNRINWHSKQESRLARDYVELGNAQLFDELRAMGERFTSAETSKTGFVAALTGRTAPNPYNDYIKTALGISEKENYTLWAEANEKLEGFFDTAFRAAKLTFRGASKGLLPYEDANKIMARFGLGNPYEAASNALNAYTNIANKLPPERYLSRFVSTANSILAATVIRLDGFQSLINAVSTPVLLLSEANSVISNPKVAKLLTTELPDGSGRSIPAVSKLLYQSVNNFFDKSITDKWMPLYKEAGIVRNKSAEFYEMIDQLTLPYGKFTESESLQKLKNATKLGAKLSGSEYSEEFGRFIAADVARQIFEATGAEGQTLTDNISTFVNRVHGNYVASQRPVAFQGPIGQAIGLFQTYQFNLLQQVFRYVENGEGKTLAILAGMQTSLFGLQGLPGFAAINNHILGNAANNPTHADLYSAIPNLLDKKLGDYLLYGSISNWLNTGLYGRGDINPRQITILPTNPLDYPAISGGVRFISNILDTTDKITKGGGVAPSLLLGLEHNGLSRPLAGLAQLVQGFVTTSKGSLVASTGSGVSDSNVIGNNDFYSFANFSRLLGARPLDEAVAMDSLYRSTLYTAKDTARREALGEAVKTTMYNGQHPSEDETTNFATEYAKSGGRISEFGSQMMKWSNDANASVANKMFRNLKNPQAQNMMMIMGGQPLPDFRNSGSTATASDASTVEK